ncbi:MAG: hypothetical protein K6G63_05440 [Eubacterium sp.]|nr:hypothetical protein [Eubacterium sp.]
MNKNVVLQSMQPIDAEHRRLSFLCSMGFALGCFVGIFLKHPLLLILIYSLLGMGMGWILKIKLLNSRASHLREYTFSCDNKLPYPNIIDSIAPSLEHMNMEIVAANNKSLTIAHDGKYYNIAYNKDDSFSINCSTDKSKVVSIINPDGLYQDLTVDMGIIAYIIQNVTKQSA